MRLGLHATQQRYGFLVTNTEKNTASSLQPGHPGRMIAIQIVSRFTKFSASFPGNWGAEGKQRNAERNRENFLLIFSNALPNDLWSARREKNSFNLTLEMILLFPIFPLLNTKEMTVHRCAMTRLILI